MGFGLPSALGAAAAFDGKDGRPKRTVVDIDGDGSFLMNIQVRCVCEGGGTTVCLRPLVRASLKAVRIEGRRCAVVP